MISSVDHIIIVVKNLDQAISDYEKILGIAPCWKGKHNELGTENALFNFENTYLELLSPCNAGPGTEFINSFLAVKGDHLAGVALGTKNIEHAKEVLNKDGYEVEISSGEATSERDGKIRRWKNILLPSTLSRELFIFIIEHIEGSLPMHENQDASKVKKLDHVVINTQDADNFISIYRDVYKTRLALDKTIEHWKRRMLFFRVNATTIEVIETVDEDDTEPTSITASGRLASLREEIVTDDTPKREGTMEDRMKKFFGNE